MAYTFGKRPDLQWKPTFAHIMREDGMTVCEIERGRKKMEFSPVELPEDKRVCKNCVLMLWKEDPDAFEELGLT